MCNLQFAICNLQFPSRKGFVLVLVLMVVALLTLVCFTFSELMFTERKAAVIGGRQAQALAAAESGLQKARIFLYKSKDTQNQDGGWYDNASFFGGVLVVNDASPSVHIRVTLIAPVLENGLPGGGIRYGMENESAKLNINNILSFAKSSTGSSTSTDSSSTSGTTSTTKSTTSSKSTTTSGSTSGTSSTSDSSSTSSSSGARDILMNLPGMTQEIADSILDWIDADDQTRDSGAESDYYSTLQPPYKPKNGPLTTIDELLLVRGVTPLLLFGGDVNRNGRIDTDENSNASIPNVDNSDGSMNLGWVPYLTLYSKESNTTASDGTAKIDLNGSDLQQLYTDLQKSLSAEQAAFICAYRIYGAPTSTSAGGTSGVSGTGGASGTGGTASISASVLGDLSQQTGSNKISSVLDLIGAKVSVTPTSSSGGGQSGGGQSGSGQSGGGQSGGGQSGSAKATIYASPFTETAGDMKSYLPTLMDYTSVSSSATVGRININLAPKAVLMCIPGMTSDIVEEIIARRTMDPTNADKSMKFAIWLLSEEIVTLKQMKALEKYITCGGDVYRVQAIGYFDDGGVAARIEVVLDASTQPATVLFWRDISHLGRGFTLEELGTQATQ
jgi:type II secretory pathway component PulK